MKKIFSLIIIVLFVFALSSCSSKAKMSKRVERMIQKAYTSLLNEDESFDYTKIKVEYLGKYHKVHCAIIEGDNYINHDMKKEELYFSDYMVLKVNGVIYPFVNKPGIVSVYYKNKHYSLVEAYEEGIFLESDVSRLYEYCLQYVDEFKLYAKTLYLDEYKKY